MCRHGSRWGDMWELASRDIQRPHSDYNSVWVEPKRTNDQHTAQSSRSCSAPRDRSTLCIHCVHCSQVSRGPQSTRSLSSHRSNGYREHLRETGAADTTEDQPPSPVPSGHVTRHPPGATHLPNSWNSWSLVRSEWEDFSDQP